MSNSAAFRRRVRMRAVLPAAVALAGALAAVAVLAGCATSGLGSLPQEQGLNPRLTRFAYIEEGRLVALAVDTAPTRYREKEPYVPFGVGLANFRLPTLHLTRESFTLVDDAGHRYSLPAVKEVRKAINTFRYDLDRSLDFFRRFDNRNLALDPIGFVFFPFQNPPAELRSFGTVRDEGELPRNHFMLTLLYFPHPEGELLGRRYELWLDSSDLDEPFFVRFKVE